MAYVFEGIFAVDVKDPSMVAVNAPITIYDPADPTRTPLVITDETGLPLPNPVVSNEHGFVTEFNADLPQVGWAGGGLNGFANSYRGMLNAAVAAKDAAGVAADAAMAAAQAAQDAAGSIGQDLDIEGITAALAESQAAVQTANAASAAAKTAAQAAESVSGTATAALNNSNSALSTANSASTQASTAINAATTAQSTANAALARADDAFVNAGSSLVLGSPNSTPVQKTKILVDTNTGRSFSALDIGPTPRTNLVSNPRFRKRASVGNPVTVARPTPLTARIGTYNVFGAGVSGESTPWANRKSSIAEYVAASGASLVGLQELSNRVPDQAGDIVAILGGTWKSATGKTSGTLANGFLWDSSVWQMEGTTTTWPLPGTEFRNLVMAKFKHLPSGVFVYVGSAHLSLNPKTTTVADQYRTIGSVVKATKAATDLEVIIAGDWAWNNTDADLGPILPSYGLYPIKTKGTPVLTRGDWNTFNDWDPTMNARLFSSWIDQLYVTSGVTVDSASVEAQFANGISLPLVSPVPSDHQMVTADVKVTSALAVVMQRSDGAAVSSGNGAVTYQDSTWSVDGSGSSACIDPKNSTGAATCFYPVANSDAMGRVGMVAGGTYSVSGYFHLEQAQTGTLDSKARRITIGVMENGVTNYSRFESVAADNAPGTTRLSVTFTIPAGATQCFVRLMNGSRVEKAWWDCLLIENVVTGVTYPLPYFDGNTNGCWWVLDVNNSRSEYPGPRWVKMGA